MIPFHIPKGIKIIKEHHFEYASIRVRNDGIVQVNSAEDFLYTMTETINVHEKVNDLTDNKPMLILHVPGKFTSVDSETRKFLASKHGLRFTIAQAYVITSMAQKMVANFFMRVNKPIKPTRFFNVQNEAEKWLLTF